jgi:hypothetical protein
MSHTVATFYGETRPSWTQGGNSYPGRDNSKDTVIGTDGRAYTSDQATIWRWDRPLEGAYAEGELFGAVDSTHVARTLAGLRGELANVLSRRENELSEPV